MSLIERQVSYAIFASGYFAAGVSVWLSIDDPYGNVSFEGFADTALAMAGALPLVLAGLAMGMLTAIRLRRAGWSAWWSLLVMVPILNIAVMFAVACLRDRPDLPCSTADRRT